MKKRRAIFISGLVGTLIIFGGLFIYINFFFGKYLNETVMEDSFLLASEWKEIDIQDLVKIEKEINYISILLEPPYKAITEGGRRGIKVPGGEIINPEIKIIDEDGKEYLLTYGGSRYSGYDEYANYRYQTNLPTNTKYKKVLVRSNIPIKAQKIIWISYNARDLP